MVSALSNERTKRSKLFLNSRAVNNSFVTTDDEIYTTDDDTKGQEIIVRQRALFYIDFPQQLQQHGEKKWKPENEIENVYN